MRTFVINPRSDRAFVARVEAEGEAAADAKALEMALRADYPQVVVRPRQLEGEREEVWYVYREGTWIPPR